MGQFEIPFGLATPEDVGTKLILTAIYPFLTLSLQCSSSSEPGKGLFFTPEVLTKLHGKD
jgi:hypothetical protein